MEVFLYIKVKLQLGGAHDLQDVYFFSIRQVFCFFVLYSFTS